MKNNVLENFERQSYARKNLVVVENCTARGSFPKSAATVLKSDNHQSAARNVALKMIRSAGPQAYFVCMDDDDLYGEDYLLEHATNAEPGVVNGKIAGWVKFDKGPVFFGNSWPPVSQFLIGGTIGGFANDVPDFPMLECSEDAAFCGLCLSRGLDIRLLSPLHYCYNRSGSPLTHAYKADARKVWRHCGGSGVPGNGDLLKVISTAPYGPALSFEDWQLR